MRIFFINLFLYKYKKMKYDANFYEKFSYEEFEQLSMIKKKQFYMHKDLQ